MCVGLLAAKSLPHVLLESLVPTLQYHWKKLKAQAIRARWDLAALQGLLNQHDVPKTP